MHTATLSLPDTPETEDAMQSLVPEAEEGMRRVEINLVFDEKKIEIEAKDTRALRAALNSYLRWLNISNEISNEIDQKKIN